MAIKSNTWTTISWIFSLIFIALAILNAFFVHIVPGLIYGVLAFLYYPPVNPLIKKKLRFSVSPILKIVLGLLVLWGTLAVGDLMEVFESWYLK